MVVWRLYRVLSALVELLDEIEKSGSKSSCTCIPPSVSLDCHSAAFKRILREARSVLKEAGNNSKN